MTTAAQLRAHQAAFRRIIDLIDETGFGPDAHRQIQHTLGSIRGTCRLELLVAGVSQPERPRQEPGPRHTQGVRMTLGDLWDPDDLPSVGPRGEQPTTCARCGMPLTPEKLARSFGQPVCDPCWATMMRETVVYRESEC